MTPLASEILLMMQVLGEKLSDLGNRALDSERLGDFLEWFSITLIAAVLVYVIMLGIIG